MKLTKHQTKLLTKILAVLLVSLAAKYGLDIDAGDLADAMDNGAGHVVDGGAP